MMQYDREGHHNQAITCIYNTKNQIIIKRWYMTYIYISDALTMNDAVNYEACKHI